MFVAFGLILGTGLRAVVANWGGNGWIFFALWSTMCALHCFLVTRAEQYHSLADSWFLHLALIIALPLATGLLPFYVHHHFV